MAQLRARSPFTPALAHTADDSSDLHTRLRAAGFDEVLVKPLTAVRLRKAVERLLGRGPGYLLHAEATGSAPAEFPLWDQATALAALNGNQEHVATLRRMFIEELGRQHDEIHESLRLDKQDAARQVLHQLKASSGFVGAMRLQAAAAALERSPRDARSLEEFSDTVRDTAALPEP